MKDHQSHSGPRGQGPRGRRRPDRAGFDPRSQPTTSSSDRSEIRGWFIGNLAEGWFTSEPEISVDDYEILVVGTLAPIDAVDLDDEARKTASSARIARFREDTRERRITIAADAEARFGRKVSWGAKVDETTELFTTASVPVMTRLRMDQRRTLDTLVEANVARSRSEALAWCVELVSLHESEWIATLRSALDTVTQAREAGPQSVN